jgi:protein arginine kinase activator
MLCDICHKNPATIHIQEIINNEKKSLHICPECAAEKSQNDPLLKGFNLAEMLYNLSGQVELPDINVSESDIEESQIMLVCPECGWDTTKFRRTGRLGCCKCYEVFHNILTTALENMHRGKLHVGKKPGTTAKANESGRLMMELMKLQKELEELVLREEYEQAAVVRDKINELKKKAG